ncbi:MAG TPA: T9SS type A sorting domain-containing protein, partial [Chitinophagales bacterium]|nr:T9SS type A sorting domain-containing protein [Chitinophagales bacterium]
TTDGGEVWLQQISSTSKDLFGIDFTTSRIGTAVGTGSILRTIDGGAIWVDQSISFTSDLYDVCFADNIHGWTAGQSGKLYYTNDGGGLTNVSAPAFFLDQLCVYPNPATNHIFITFELITTFSLELTVNDINGKEVMNVKTPLLPAGKNKLPLNVHLLPSVSYIVKWKTAENLGANRMFFIDR